MIQRPSNHSNENNFFFLIGNRTPLHIKITLITTHTCSLTGDAHHVGRKGDYKHVQQQNLHPSYYSCICRFKLWLRYSRCMHGCTYQCMCLCVEYMHLHLYAFMMPAMHVWVCIYICIYVVDFGLCRYLYALYMENYGIKPGGWNSVQDGWQEKSVPQAH